MFIKAHRQEHGEYEGLGVYATAFILVGVTQISFWLEPSGSFSQRYYVALPAGRNFYGPVAPAQEFTCEQKFMSKCV